MGTLSKSRKTIWVEELLVKGLEIMINGIHLFHQSRISETAVYKGQDTNIGTPLEIFDLREIHQTARDILGMQRTIKV